MGRNNTGAVSVKEANQLNLTELLRSGAIAKGKTITGTISWSSGSSMNFTSSYLPTEKYLDLSYTINKESYRFRVDLYTRPSNLGKGEVLYFVCPETYRLCRILYRAYSYPTYKSRTAYRNRLYYPLQLFPSRMRDNSKYFYYEALLEKLYDQRQSYTFKGRPTKRLQRLERIEERRDEADQRRWNIATFPASLQKLLNS